jgi:hypothetical protein
MEGIFLIIFTFQRSIKLQHPPDIIILENSRRKLLNPLKEKYGVHLISVGDINKK